MRGHSCHNFVPGNIACTLFRWSR